MCSDDPDRNPTEIELRAFIGPRAANYWRRWRWYIENGKQGAGGLWPPLLFNFVWFLYRRMYREVWIPVAMIVPSLMSVITPSPRCPAPVIVLSTFVSVTSEAVPKIKFSLLSDIVTCP